MFLVRSIGLLARMRRFILARSMEPAEVVSRGAAEMRLTMARPSSLLRSLFIVTPFMAALIAGMIFRDWLLPIPALY